MNGSMSLFAQAAYGSYSACAILDSFVRRGIDGEEKVSRGINQAEPGPAFCISGAFFLWDI